MGFWSEAPLTQEDVDGLGGVYGEGARAFANGQFLKDCPYGRDSLIPDWQQLVWINGYADASTDPRYIAFRSTKPMKV